MSVQSEEIQKTVEIITKNLELLRITFNTLQQLVQLEQAKGKAINTCEAFTLAAASKIVYENWEKEKRKLPSARVGELVCSKEFIHTPFSISPELKNDIAKAVANSTFFKTVWPNVKRG